MEPVLETHESTIDAKLFKVLPPLRDKCIIDLVNGLEVTKDHINVQRAPKGFVRRALNCLSGKSAKHQVEINASLASSLEATIVLLEDQFKAQTLTNFALADVARRVSRIEENIAALAECAIDTRTKVEALAEALASSNRQLEERLSQVDLEQKANRHIEHVFSAWEAGQYDTFSLAGQQYAALETLRCGYFGNYYESKNATVGDKRELLEHVINKSIIQLRKRSPESACVLPFWFQEPQEVLPGATEAIQYLAHEAEPDTQPFIFTIAHPEQVPLALPRIFKPERIAWGMTNELFPGSEYHE